MGQLPVKFRIFQIISEQENISNEEIYQQVKAEYPLDRHVTPAGIDNYLMSLHAVGLIRSSFTQLSQEGRIIQRYQLTPGGLTKRKYVGHT